MRRRSFLRGASAAVFSAAAYGGMPPPKKARITSSVVLDRLPGSVEKRLETAARAGLQSVEFSGDFCAWTTLGINRVKRLARSFKLGVDAIPAFPCGEGSRFSMVEPAQREKLLAEIRHNIALARELGAPMLTLTNGLYIPGHSTEEQYRSLLEATKRCGELAAQAGIKILLEPLSNPPGGPEHFLATCAEGVKLIREADNPHVRLLFHCYHEQVQTGNLTKAIELAAPYTDVYRVADFPGRGAPGTGTIDFPAVYHAIAKTDFRGWITMDYLPQGDPVRSLIASVDQMRAALQAAA